MRLRLFTLIALMLLHCCFGVFAYSKSLITQQAKSTADYAFSTYAAAMTDSLAKMVAYKTVMSAQLPFEKNTEFSGFKAYIKDKAKELGLDYKDHGYVLIVGLGTSQQKLGIITHGDVLPANPQKWAKSPFILDKESEPGRLIARGAEDDKSPIATALYAMKAIRDKEIKLQRRIELIIYLAEESDWAPIRAFLKTYEMADLNITIDAEYPVVTAEKGWCLLQVTIPFEGKETADSQSQQATIAEFSGGYFNSQVPEDAIAVIKHGNKALIDKIIRYGEQHHPGISYKAEQKSSHWQIHAKGKSAHSSKPWDGKNAINHLADALSIHAWPISSASLVVNYLHELIGLGLYGEQFGDISYKHDFMGSLTVSPTVVKSNDKGIQININLRRPAGKSDELLTKQIHSALNQWQKKYQLTLQAVQLSLGQPYEANNAPHVQTLLNVFSEFTGIKNPQPVAIGGSTNGKLFPGAVSFGPSMPGEPYTGHSEHEYISVEQLHLNLKMYTAMMIELGNLIIDD